MVGQSKIVNNTHLKNLLWSFNFTIWTNHYDCQSEIVNNNHFLLIVFFRVSSKAQKYVHFFKLKTAFQGTHEI